MNPNKTTILRFKPIAEITDEEMKEEVLATDGHGFWLQGLILSDDETNYDCIDNLFRRRINNVTMYAVLPKDE